MIKFLHTSDWHAGAGRKLAPRDWNTGKKDYNNSDYINRALWHWRACIEVARAEKVEFAIIAGDMFEDPSTTIEELLALYQALKEFGEVCPVVVTPGNHDETTIGEFQQCYLKLMGIPNVIITQKEPQSLELPGGIKVMANPWTGIKKQAEFDKYLESNYKQEHIVILHECFKGITTDVGWRSTGGVSIPTFPGVKYFACGDIHKYQKLNLPNAFYSGAPGQWNFGDKPNKGVIVVEVHDMEFDWRPRFVPIRSAIELHQVRDIAHIPKNSTHWYKLIVEAGKIPHFIPNCVRDLEILPTKVAIPQVMKGEDDDEEDDTADLMNIDYTEGVDLLLESAGYNPKQILEVTDELRKVAQ
jgi:DNA repair exonuclease SbcCD nuclease subunit